MRRPRTRRSRRCPSKTEYCNAEWSKERRGYGRFGKRVAQSLAAGMATTGRIGEIHIFDSLPRRPIYSRGARPAQSRPVAVKMPESPPFLGIPILLEVGPFIGVRGPLAATIAYC